MIFFENLVLGFDKSVFFFFQDLQNPWLDLYFAWPTRMGEVRIILILLTFGIVIFDKKRCPLSIPAGMIAILTASWISPVLKAFFRRPRPYVFWENSHVIFQKPQDAAFPSGHTAVIFSAAFVVARYYPRQASWAYAVAVWVGVTRLYVGVHYPSDLLGGAALGALCGWLACRSVELLDRSITLKLNKPGRIL
jgi:undecaprenyl-diphosphatase